MGTSLVVQWIGIQLAGDGGSIPVQGTKIQQTHGTAKTKQQEQRLLCRTIF